jgi:hypothetical protein
MQKLVTRSHIHTHIFKVEKYVCANFASLPVKEQERGETLLPNAMQSSLPNKRMGHVGSIRNMIAPRRLPIAFAENHFGRGTEVAILVTCSRDLMIRPKQQDDINSLFLDQKDATRTMQS